MTYAIKKGDREPSFTSTLEAPAGTPVDLTGASVTFLMTLQGATTPTVNAAASVVSAADGTVRYDWGAADTATVGIYKAEWKVTFLSGHVRRFPADDYLYIEVTAALS